MTGMKTISACAQEEVSHERGSRRRQIRPRLESSIQRQSYSGHAEQRAHMHSIRLSVLPPPRSLHAAHLDPPPRCCCSQLRLAFRARLPRMHRTAVRRPCTVHRAPCRMNLRCSASLSAGPGVLRHAARFGSPVRFLPHKLEQHSSCSSARQCQCQHQCRASDSNGEHRSLCVVQLEGSRMRATCGALFPSVESDWARRQQRNSPSGRDRPHRMHKLQLMRQHARIKLFL